MRLGLLTSIWRRHDLARVVLEHHAMLDIPGVELVPLAVGSEGTDSKRLAHDSGWHYAEAPNSPLSDKMNEGLKAFRTAGVDGVVIIGSDDLLNAAYFEHAAATLAAGKDVLELRGIYFYNAPTDELVYADAWSTGVGRCLSARLLNAREWVGWESGQDTHLDHAMRTQAVVHGRERAWVADLRKTDIRVVDIKTEENLWSYAWCVNEITRPDRRHPVPDTRTWFERHFPGTYDAIHNPEQTPVTTDG